MTKLSNQSFLSVAGGMFAVVLSGVASAQVSAYPSASPSATVHALESSVATQLISNTSLQQMLTISNAVGFRMGILQSRPANIVSSNQTFGLAAGGNEKWNAWGSLSANNNEYKGFDQDVTTAVSGLDYTVAPTLVAGASVAYDRSTGSLFNITTTGYTVAPYLGWQINKDWSLDASMGWGEGKTNIGTNEIKPDRFFYGTNLSYTQWSGNWQFTGKASYLYGEEKYESTLLNAKNKIDQWRLGGQAGYWMAGGIMPYFGLAYSTDDTKTALAGTNDLGKNAWTVSVGANFFSLANNLTGGIVYNQ